MAFSHYCEAAMQVEIFWGIRPRRTSSQQRELVRSINEDNKYTPYITML